MAGLVQGKVERLCVQVDHFACDSDVAARLAVSIHSFEVRDSFQHGGSGGTAGGTALQRLLGYHASVRTPRDPQACMLAAVVEVVRGGPDAGAEWRVRRTRRLRRRAGACLPGAACASPTAAPASPAGPARRGVLAALCRGTGCGRPRCGCPAVAAAPSRCARARCLQRLWCTLLAVLRPPAAACVRRAACARRCPTGCAPARPGCLRAATDVYIQRCEIHPFVVTVDYRPRRVDVAALRRCGVASARGGGEEWEGHPHARAGAERLPGRGVARACPPLLRLRARSGNFAEVINLVPWGGVSLHFRHLRLFGMQGLTGLGERAGRPVGGRGVVGRSGGVA